jgi:hypothetical protein
MAGLDKERINAVIEEASKGSKFYTKQQEDQARLDAQAHITHSSFMSLLRIQFGGFELGNISALLYCRIRNSADRYRHPGHADLE